MPSLNLNDGFQKVICYKFIERSTIEYLISILKLTYFEVLKAHN